MSSHLRDDNECQNCGYTVDRAYCSNCGQKNTETRQPFHHLFTHFVEDLTHYDGAFWKTIKHLLFRPGRLTKEYLEGKRQTYVPPVKLYIFISFVTFFLMSLILHKGEEEVSHSQSSSSKERILSFGDDNYTSIKDFENKELAKPESERYGLVSKWIIKKMIIATQRDFSEEDLYNGFFNILPKVLFLYMPIFAFWLWLFHGKKRWYFFDHGIFTLHYFSFLLLLVLLSLIIFTMISFVPGEVAGIIGLICFPTFTLYSIFYFFRAHRRMYGEKRWISRLKSFTLFFINTMLITLFIFAAFVYAYITVH